MRRILKTDRSADQSHAVAMQIDAKKFEQGLREELEVIIRLWVIQRQEWDAGGTSED
jgi:hypothetical protein